MQILDVKAEVGKSQGMVVEKMVLIYQGKVRVLNLLRIGTYV